MQLIIGLAAVLAMLAQSGAARWSYGPGVCGPLDPSYVRTATETGGQPFPTSPAEIANLTRIMTEASHADATMILWAGGSAAEVGDGFVVPVDRSVTRVTFAITFDGTGGSADIVAPGGTAIQPNTTPDDAILSCGRILSLDTPAVGAWQVTPRPSGRFWLVVHGRSERDVLSAEFVRSGGRPGHEGLFRFDGMPVAGRPALLRVRFVGPQPAAPDVVLISGLGRPIQRVPLERVADNELLGDVALPPVPFRVAISGTDESGAAYQRLDSVLRRAESVEVVPSAVDTIAAGQDAVLTFTVRNHGPRSRYRVTATVGAEVLQRIEPAVVDIEQGSEGRVKVFVPAATIEAAGEGFELLVVASQEDGARASSNSAFHRLRVVKE